MSKIHVTTTINGDRSISSAIRARPCLTVLRDRLGMTGSKEGCGTGIAAPVPSPSRGGWSVPA